MSILLEETKILVKEAREQAYLGKYKEALAKFQEQLPKLSQQLQCLRGDPTLEPEWSRMVSSLSEEYEVIKILYSFQHGIIAQESPQRHQPRTLDDQYFDQKQQPQSQLPFNQIPFAQQRNNNKENNHHFYDISPPKNVKVQSEQNFEQEHPPNPRVRREEQPQSSYVQQQPRDDENFIANLRNPGPPKDPDVWDPPPNQNRSRKNPNKVQKPKQQNNNQNPFQSPPINQNGKKRDYNKPWLANANKDTGEPKPKSDERKKFINHAYPDGHGPDTDLINMLEREVVDLNPNIKFEDIAELELAKEVLQEAVLLPILMPNLFKGIRTPIKGVLLYGPPGTGKTMLAKAVATIGKTTFFNVSASSLASKWRGESEKLVRLLFEMARFYAPSTIFFDEIDALGSQRSSGEHEASRKVKTEMLIQMDGVQNVEERKIVTVLAATNRPWDLDDALMRRLERRIYIPLPTTNGRKILFDINLKDEQVDQNLDWDTLLKKTEGFSGADISIFCREAAMFPLRRRLKEEGGLQKLSEQAIKDFQDKFNVPLTQKDFEEALKNIKKSVTNNYLKEHENWMAEYGNA